jgi:hypothetical protein
VSDVLVNGQAAENTLYRCLRRRDIQCSGIFPQFLVYLEEGEPHSVVIDEIST